LFIVVAFWHCYILVSSSISRRGFANKFLSSWSTIACGPTNNTCCIEREQEEDSKILLGSPLPVRADTQVIIIIWRGGDDALVLALTAGSSSNG